MTNYCDGNSSDHCCHLGKDGVCVYLEENTVENRHWACGLLRELGSWDAVHSDERYLTNVRPFWEQYAPDLNCGDWPRPNEICGACGINGNG